MSFQTTEIPKFDASRDLTDAEFEQLDTLLQDTPEPLTPCDAVMLDGYLCGVIVQPVIQPPEEWLRYVFDFEGEALPADTDAVWKDRVVTLIMRRHAALNLALVEDGWFDPLVLEFDEEHPRELPPEGEPDPLADLSPIELAVMPWVAGFNLAVETFPDLAELGDVAVDTAISRLYRFLPANDDAEREIVELMNREHPIATMDDAIEELVSAVADLADLTREQRYRVETVKREGPKLGRNDPCHCGSGKKYKQCHGAA